MAGTIGRALGYGGIAAAILTVGGAAAATAAVGGAAVAAANFGYNYFNGEEATNPPPVMTARDMDAVHDSLMHDAPIEHSRARAAVAPQDHRERTRTEPALRPLAGRVTVSTARRRAETAPSTIHQKPSTMRVVMNYVASLFSRIRNFISEGVHMIHFTNELRSLVIELDNSHGDLIHGRS